MSSNKSLSTDVFIKKTVKETTTLESWPLSRKLYQLPTFAYVTS